MRRTKLIALLFGALALLGACAQEDDPTVAEPDETAEAIDEATDEPADGEDEGATVAVADSEEHGEILVDGDGMTLYVFLQDADGKSNCADACAETWPPLTTDGDPVGDGVDQANLDTIERADGDTQVTYNDRPLYTYAADEAEGDTKGQGVGGNWYVVGTDGEPMKD